MNLKGIASVRRWAKASMWLLVIGALLIASGVSFADKVCLKDGSIVNGEVLKVVDGKVTVKTTFAGEISFPIAEVVNIETAQSMPVHLKDGSIINGTIEMKSPDKIEVVRKAGEAGVPIDASELAAVNPPPPEKPKWKGAIVGNLGVTSGNSETTNVGVTADLNKRAEDDRINLRGGYFYSKDDGKGTRDDQFLLGKYDYFFSEKWFGYLTSRLDRDVIRDLNLRTTGGAGMGYQFIEDPIYNLFGEAGISYVNEDYGTDADDSNYVAGRLAGHFGWWIIKDKLEFKEDVEVLLGIEDVNDWFAISETGLAWKWNAHWTANAGVRYEYDNTPATGYERADTKYLVGLGYSF